MKSVSLSDFPGTMYHPDAHLVTWHPRGVLDDRLAERIVNFLETEELIADAPFKRYTDLSGITEVHLKVAHTFRMAERRSRNYSGAPVRSAFFAEWIVTLGFARLYEELMRGAPIEVCVFQKRQAVAAWLQVPVDLLSQRSITGPGDTNSSPLNISRPPSSMKQ